MKFLAKYGLLSLVILMVAMAGLPELIGAPDALALLAAGPYVAIDVFKTVGGGAPSNKKDMVTFIRLSEVDQSTLARDEKGVLIPQNIVMKAGKYMTRVYGTIDKTAPGFTTEGETDTRGFQHSLGFEHPGDSQEINEFLVAWLNDDIICIVQECGTNVMKVIGTPCHPLQLVPEFTDNNEAVKHTLNLQGVGRTRFPIGKYDGTLTLEEPLAVIADDDTSPSVAAGSGQYQLSENTVATEITTLDDAQHGYTYTLLGTGGATASTIPAGNDFELKDGVAWTAAQGAAITFKAYKNGVASFVFVEISRS